VEDVKAIAVSPTGTGACALGNDGTVTCWPGGSLSGDYNIADPVVIPDIDDATQLTVGGSHACVLREGGRVSCWGYNDDGQLGSGKAEEGTIRSGLALRGASFVPTPTSVDVVGVEDVQTIAAGVADTCAVLASGETLCWGANSKEGNQLALPDYNYNTFRSDPVPSPQGIPRLPAAYANIGESHGCALTVTGNVWCWGLGKLVGQARPTQAYNAPAPLPAP
jgi:alpha-tubulin suppressor-like RCC1 family protein